MINPIHSKYSNSTYINNGIIRVQPSVAEGVQMFVILINMKVQLFTNDTMTLLSKILNINYLPLEKLITK